MEPCTATELSETIVFVLAPWCLGRSLAIERGEGRAGRKWRGEAGEGEREGGAGWGMGVAEGGGRGSSPLQSFHILVRRLFCSSQLRQTIQKPKPVHAHYTKRTMAANQMICGVCGIIQAAPPPREDFIILSFCVGEGLPCKCERCCMCIKCIRRRIRTAVYMYLYLPNGKSHFYE